MYQYTFGKFASIEGSTISMSSTASRIDYLQTTHQSILRNLVHILYLHSISMQKKCFLKPAQHTKHAKKQITLHLFKKQHNTHLYKSRHLKEKPDAFLDSSLHNKL